jgi:hypothetical protein
MAHFAAFDANWRWRWPLRSLLIAQFAPCDQQLLRLQQRFHASLPHRTQLAFFEPVSWYRRQYPLPVANLVGKCGV